jgi:hypothetical protein
MNRAFQPNDEASDKVFNMQHVYDREYVASETVAHSCSLQCRNDVAPVMAGTWFYTLSYIKIIARYTDGK